MFWLNPVFVQQEDARMKTRNFICGFNISAISAQVHARGIIIQPNSCRNWKNNSSSRETCENRTVNTGRKKHGFQNSKIWISVRSLTIMNKVEFLCRQNCYRAMMSFDNYLSTRKINFISCNCQYPLELLLIISSGIHNSQHPDSELQFLHRNQTKLKGGLLYMLQSHVNIASDCQGTQGNDPTQKTNDPTI